MQVFQSILPEFSEQNLNKTPVRDRICKSIPIHASVIFHISFRENFNVAEWHDFRVRLGSRLQETLLCETADCCRSWFKHQIEYNGRNLLVNLCHCYITNVCNREMWTLLSKPVDCCRSWCEQDVLLATEHWLSFLKPLQDFKPGIF